MNQKFLKKYNMPTNRKYIVELRNATILWVVIGCVLLSGLWFSLDFFSKLGQQLEEHNQKKIQTIDNIKMEGIISDKQLAEGMKDGLRLSTIKNLVPSITTTLGIGTTEEQKNLATLRKITQKDTSEKDYITWLQASWDESSKKNLDTLQEEIAEIIPIFS